MHPISMFKVPLMSQSYLTYPYNFVSITYKLFLNSDQQLN